MSTEIPCASNDGHDRRIFLEVGNLSGYKEPRMYLRVQSDGKEAGLVNPTRADFLAAVAAECNVIVVERAGLPKAGLTSDGTEVYAGNGDDATRWMKVSRGAEAARRAALAHLAIAEYLDANPPVDEALVDDLATVAYRNFPPQASFDRSDASEYIRALIKSGRIEVKP